MGGEEAGYEEDDEVVNAFAVLEKASQLHSVPRGALLTLTSSHLTLWPPVIMYRNASLTDYDQGSVKAQQVWPSYSPPTSSCSDRKHLQSSQHTASFPTHTISSIPDARRFTLTSFIFAILSSFFFFLLSSLDMTFSNPSSPSFCNEDAAVSFLA